MNLHHCFGIKLLQNISNFFPIRSSFSVIPQMAIRYRSGKTMMHGARWSDIAYRTAIAVYLKSPAAYRSLTSEEAKQNGQFWPSEDSVRKRLTCFARKEGIHDNEVQPEFDRFRHVVATGAIWTSSATESAAEAPSSPRATSNFYSRPHNVFSSAFSNPAGISPSSASVSLTPLESAPVAASLPIASASPVLDIHTPVSFAPSTSPQNALPPATASACAVDFKELNLIPARIFSELRKLVQFQCLLIGILPKMPDKSRIN
jgi:hypothetical protein